MNTKVRLVLLIIVVDLFMIAAFLLGIGTFSKTAFAATQSCVSGPHSGIISADEDWCLVDSPHQLSADVTINPGVNLTIEPGVTVMGGSGIDLKVQGDLQALGTPAQPITFTSVTNTGGGQWAGLAFDGGTGHLRYATVRYGGSGTNGSGTYSNIGIRNTLSGEVLLESCQVSDSQNAFYTEYGLYIENGRATISDTLFSGNGNGGAAAPLYITGADSDATLEQNSFTGNSRNRIVLAPGAMMGHDTTLAPQDVLQGYELENDFTVPPTVTLTVEPGATIMGGSSVELRVQGDLQALGTPTQPITFTSVADSGGGEWAGLAFDGGTGHLRNATVRYGGAATNGSGSYSNIGIQNTLSGEVLLESCQVIDSYNASKTEYGLYINNGRATISDTLFSGNGNGGAAAPLYISGPDSDVTMTQNSFSGNSRNRIVLAPGAMMGHDATLTPQAVLQGYELANDFTVPPTVTLTVEPGVTIMGGDSIELKVQGDLQALGTPTQPITFTSVANSGGGEWAGVVFDGGIGHLRYATVRYGGGGTNSSGTYSNMAIQNMDSGEVLLESCQVSDSFNAFYTEYGLYINNGRGNISDTLFSNIGNGTAAPLYIAGADSVVTMTDNSFSGNSRDRIVLASGAMMGHDATLTPQTVSYELENDFTVPPTVTLTLEPGVTIMGGDGDELKVQGDLQALGTATQPITLTSVTNTGAGQWAGLLFDAGTGHLRHAIVRYGGNSNSAGVNSNIAVQNTLDGEVFLESCQVRDSSHYSTDYGLYINGGQVTVSDSDISRADSLLYVTGDSTVIVDGSVIEESRTHGIDVEGDLAWLRATNSSIWSNGALSGDGVHNAGSSTVILSGDPEMGNFIAYNQNYGANQAGATGQIIATHNYWGDPSGPTHSGNPAGIGEPVTDRVLYDPWLTEPPTPTFGTEILVQGVGPRYISPGETVILGVLFNNYLTETLLSTVVVAQLPAEAEYLMSTGGGQYWPERHQVVWQLGDVTAGTAQQYGIQVTFEWGLPAHYLMQYAALGAAANLPNKWMTLDDYLAYTEVSVESLDPVSDTELNAILAADPYFNALYQSAGQDGFVYYGAAQMEQLSNGRSRLALVMINRAKSGERMDLYRDQSTAVIVHTTPMYEEIYDLTGGFRFYFETGAVTSWGEMRQSELLAQIPTVMPCTANSCDDFGFNDCLRNCLINRIPPGQFEAHYSSACNQCYSSGTNCQQCAHYMQTLRSDTIENDVNYCYDICNENRDDGKCDESTRHCETSTTFVETPCNDCEYDTSKNFWGSCAPGQKCINGECYDPKDPDIDDNTIESVTAHDPNALYGPQTAGPGQTIEYTVEWENEGAGTAYGVYVESALPPELDESTLQTGGNGVYFPSSRIIMWDIGELGPGAGDSVTFTVQVPASTISGTVFVAGATVYFPSVPETTPTNDVVTIVGDVVGNSQLVETDEGTAVNIVLSGYSPSGNPLSYGIVREPFNGALSGTPPNLTYTPGHNFEGIDWIAFTVNDGINTSSTAVVSIIVNNGVETTAPKVFIVAPEDGAVDVTAYGTPMYDDVYAPSIWAIFDEPMDGGTLTNRTFFVEGPTGQRVPGTISYDGTSNKAILTLNAPLLRNREYTVTLTNGVQDTSGNPLAADYVWRFNTDRDTMFLPIILH